jgi:hypothetical protein
MGDSTLLNNLRFRLVTMNGKLATLGALVAIAIMADWAFGVQQFVYYYLEFGQTDVPPEYFFILLPIFLGSFIFTAALILSAIILRLRIRHWARQLSPFAEYEPLFMPAYTGLVFDYSIDRKETLSMLLDLHFRGAIRLKYENGEFRFDVINASLETLNEAEQMLLDAALQYGGDEKLCRDALKHVFAGSRKSEHFLDFDLNHKLIKRSNILIVTIMSIGGFYTLFSVSSKIFAMDEVLSLLYPRYPATFFHLLVLGGLSLAALIIILTGFLPRFSSNHKHTHVSTWIHVAGWRYYLHTVYKDRMSPQHIFSQDPDEIKHVLPYMIALDIVNIDDMDMSRLLGYTDT